MPFTMSSEFNEDLNINLRVSPRTKGQKRMIIRDDSDIDCDIRPTRSMSKFLEKKTKTTQPMKRKLPEEMVESYTGNEEPSCSTACETKCQWTNLKYENKDKKESVMMSELPDEGGQENSPEVESAELSNSEYDDCSFDSDSSYEDDESWDIVGFARGLKPLRILAMSREGSQKYFWMKWEGSCHADTVTSEEANEKCPALVIQFYEEHLVLEPLPKEKDDSNNLTF